MKKPASQCIWVNLPPATALKKIKSNPIDGASKILVKIFSKAFPLVTVLSDLVLLIFSQNCPLSLNNLSLIERPDAIPSLNGFESSSTSFNFLKISCRAFPMIFLSTIFLKKRYPSFSKADLRSELLALSKLVSLRLPKREFGTFIPSINATI